MTTQIKTVNIRGKNYVEVAERVRLVHDQKRKFELIESEPFSVADRWLWRVKILVDGKAYKGNAEVKLNAPKNTPDGTNPFECAETSALGRALAFAGLGTVESIASFDEVYRAMQAQEAGQQAARPNIQARASQPAPASTPPAPRNLRPTAPTPAPQQSAAPTTEQAQAKATAQQKSSIEKLCQHVQMSVPDLDTMSFTEAKALITQLTAEYKKQRAESQSQAAQPAQPKITPQQAERIRSLCKALGESEPAGLAEMAYFEAKALYDQLTATYKERKSQASNGPDAPIQDKATPAMVNKAKSRVESLDMLWGDVKRDALQQQVDDKDITVAQYAKISSVIETYEQKKAS